MSRGVPYAPLEWLPGAEWTWAVGLAIWVAVVCLIAGYKREPGALIVILLGWTWEMILAMALVAAVPAGVVWGLYKLGGWIHDREGRRGWE